MQPMANMALRAARQAGQIILRAMDRVDQLHVERKARNDFVSNIDREAEQVIMGVGLADLADWADVALEDQGVIMEALLA